jgi:chromosome partitioning protein
MSRIIAFVAHKGGVGKTTCAGQVAAAMARHHGLRVLAIDLDSQSNLTKGLTPEPIPADLTSSLLLMDEGRLVTDYIISVRNNLDLIPNRYVPEQDQALAHFGDRWKNLEERLAPVRNLYDYILLDTPPAILYQTRSAIATSDLVILVMACSQFSIIGATNIVSQVMELQFYSQRRHIPIRVVINQYDERRGLDHRIRAEIERIFEKDVFKTIIRQNVRLGDAAQNCRTIFEQDAASFGAHDFTSLTREILAQFATSRRATRAENQPGEMPVNNRHKTVVIRIGQ